MKRTFILIICLISLVYLSTCSSSNKQSFYGTYSFEEVSYLSPLFIGAEDFINEHMEETKYTIEEDIFKIQFAFYIVEFSSPIYVREEIQNSTATLSDVNALIGNEVECQYSIYDNDGIKTKWRLFVSTGYLWVGSYVDNTTDGSEIIMDIYKLSK